MRFELCWRDYPETLSAVIVMKFGTRAAVTLFALVALTHFLRIVTNTGVAIEGWPVPMWFSAFGVLVPATIAWLLVRESR